MAAGGCCVPASEVWWRSRQGVPAAPGLFCSILLVVQPASQPSQLTSGLGISFFSFQLARFCIVTMSY